VIVIADNDVLKKLACCDLYAEFLAAFKVAIDQVHILNTARAALSAKRHRKQMDEASFQRLTGFLRAAKVITTAPDPDEQLALTEQQNIDDGEAVLFSIAAKDKSSRLATGDKRSLCSLASAKDTTCRRICKKLAGRVTCFEQIICTILDSARFDAVRDRLIMGRECDKVLAVVLGSGLDTLEETVREGLRSYINDLRNQSGALLADI
jgi:hypothetical protein